MKEIYVYLKEEGVDVWRPVQAEEKEDNQFLILKTDICETENWQFKPGDLVKCKNEGGKLIAVEKMI